MSLVIINTKRREKSIYRPWPTHSQSIILFLRLALTWESLSSSSCWAAQDNFTLKLVILTHHIFITKCHPEGRIPLSHFWILAKCNLVHGLLLITCKVGLLFSTFLSNNTSFCFGNIRKFYDFCPSLIWCFLKAYEIEEGRVAFSGFTLCLICL